MPQPAKGPRLGGSAAHERLMLANLATALFEHGRIVTTETKAKRLRPYAEKLITFGKRGDLHARRQVGKVIRDKSVLHTLFAEIGPRYENRPGGYTRITKLGPRKGDNAPMAAIELVESLTVAQTAVGEAERARGTQFAGRKAPTGSTAESARDLAGTSPTAAGVAADADAADAADAGTDVDSGTPGAEAPVASTDLGGTDAGTPGAEDASDAQDEGSAETGQPEGAGQTESAGETSQAEGEADKA